MASVLREALAFSLSNGAHAVGAFDDVHLVGISAWRVLPGGDWDSFVLAVATGHRRRGIGRMLKENLLAMAQNAGALGVRSVVSIDNIAMENLNESLGAETMADPSDKRFMLAYIALR